MRISPEKKSGKKTGRWILDLQDAKRGIQRTRQVFDTKKEAEDYAAALKKEGSAFLLGHRKSRTFGEVLIRYLEEIMPQKKSADTEIFHNLVTLRWPFLHEGKFIRLEDVPLEAPAGRLSIVGAMASWRADMLKIVRRSRIDGEHYHKRRDGDGERWYHQPRAEGDNPPPQRSLVTDRALLARLEAAKGDGPFAPDTLRIRQSIVKTAVKQAWLWEMTAADISSKIITERPGEGREYFLTRPQRYRLLLAAARSEYGRHLAHAIWAATIMGVRRENLFSLEWRQVYWPVRDGNDRVTQAGYILWKAGDMKAGKPHAVPMTESLERLLLRRAAASNGTLVFHQGDGKAFGSFRKSWATALKRAGLPEDFRWHDLRHAWASFLIQAGASVHDLQELGAWSTPTMPKRYAHRQTEHLLSAAELASRPRGKA